MSDCLQTGKPSQYISTSHIYSAFHTHYGEGRDVHETFWAKTKTRPRCSKFCPRRDRDVAVSETLAETLKHLRLSEVSGASMSHRDIFR